MNEAQLYELLGRKQAQIESLVDNYQKLVAIVRAIKDGSIDMERFSVADNGVWTLGPEIQKGKGKRRGQADEKEPAGKVVPSDASGDGMEAA